MQNGTPYCTGYTYKVSMQNTAKIYLYIVPKQLTIHSVNCVNTFVKYGWSITRSTAFMPQSLDTDRYYLTIFLELQLPYTLSINIKPGCMKQAGELQVGDVYSI